MDKISMIDMASQDTLPGAEEGSTCLQACGHSEKGKQITGKGERSIL
jgi:hypothetical protein